MDFEKHLTGRQDCETYQYFKFGDAYYLSQNTAIMERSKKLYLNDTSVDNPFASNHRLPSGHFKKIVDQKVMYLLGKGVQFTDAEQTDKLNAYFDDTFDETMISLGIEASKKSEAWLMAYKDNGTLRFTQIPAEQLTPVWDEYGRLKTMIRCYEADGFKWALVYDDKEVNVYRKPVSSAASYRLYKTVGHWFDIASFAGKPISNPENKGFGVVPFIPLWNNRERVSDLYGVKRLIDTYDIISSDFANNIDDMQDAFLTMRGYSGDSKDLGEFMRQLKSIKAVPVDENGDISVNQVQIPVEARKVFLELAQKDIYKFAMAVDLTGIQGGSITNVYIKAMFADLDLKCNQFESEVRKFIKHLIEFINHSENTGYTYDCNFIRSTIVNNTEVIDGLIKLSGIISNKTIRELQPYDIDEEVEDERMSEQNGGINLDLAAQVVGQNPPVGE